MIEKNCIGKEFEPLTVEVEKGQLRLFAKAVGETNTVYTDEDAAQKAGYRSLPAPPTFAFSLNLARPDPLAKYAELGISLTKMLHGGQSFEYFDQIVAGDVITLREKVIDLYEKKGGALQFLVFETSVENQHGDIVGKMTTTVVIQN